MTTVFLRLLSGELIPVEIESVVSYLIFFQEAYSLFELRSPSQLEIYRLVNDEFVPISRTSNEPLVPQPDEIFNVYIDHLTYSGQIWIDSGGWDQNQVRYTKCVFNLIEYNGDTVVRDITQGIYEQNMPFGHRVDPENMPFFLENDRIPSQIIVQGDEWERDEWNIQIPEDMSPFRGIRELIENSPLGEGLRDATKELVIHFFSRKLKKYLEGGPHIENVF